LALSLDVILCFVNLIEHPAGTWIFVNCSKWILVEVPFVHLIVEVWRFTLFPKWSRFWLTSFNIIIYYYQILGNCSWPLKWPLIKLYHEVIRTLTLKNCMVGLNFGPFTCVWIELGGC
jgi:hypothetical protein